MEEAARQSRGYLSEDFRLFHLRDTDMRPVDFHHHPFHKIMVLLSGRVTYAIEGKSYALEPGDMVLVSRGCLHRPVVSERLPYERIILYISPEFLRNLSSPAYDLETCFLRAREEFSFVLRPEGQFDQLMGILTRLEDALNRADFGQALLSHSLFLEFLITLTREMPDHELRYVYSARSDKKIQDILRYLNLHLGDSITIDALAEQFYISKYYLMRRFKDETGYTIHSYVTEKRLIQAQEQIAGGTSLVRVAENCGFGDYSTFSRAYKKRFGVSPTAATTGGGVPPLPLE